MTVPYIFFGTPDFALAVLRLLTQTGRKPLAVVCQPDRPKGRGLKLESPPVKVWAEQHSLPVLQPESMKADLFIKDFRALQPALALVVAFGQLLPKALLGIPPLGFVNVHPSLLPRYRGAAPMQWTLINGDSVTGVSILKVTPRLDDGDILLQRQVEIGPETTAQALSDQLALMGGEMAAEALSLFEQGTQTATPQDEQQVVWARALQKEDGLLDWNQAAGSLHNRIRGVQPWPGAYTSLRGKVLKVHRAQVGNQLPFVGIRPGTVVTAEADTLAVAAKDGLVRLLEVQLEGKKRLSVHDFLLGRSISTADVLGM